MPARLTITAGPNHGETFAVCADAMLLLGRGSNCDIPLKDPAVSRAHCRLGYRDGKPRISDAGSSSGTSAGGMTTLATAPRPAIAGAVLALPPLAA